MRADDDSSESPAVVAEVEGLRARIKELEAELDGIRGRSEAWRSSAGRASVWITHRILGARLLQRGREFAAELDQWQKRERKHAPLAEASEVAVAAFARFVRVGVFAVLLGLVPALLIVLQTWLLSNQNRLLEYQNSRIDLQNQEITKQNYLIESQRRSALVFELSGIFDKIDEELSGQAGEGEQTQKLELSPGLTGRIIAASLSLKPYRYLNKDGELTEYLSPERAQLLLALTSLGDTVDIEQVLARATFQAADLNGAKLRGADLRGTNLSGANLSGAHLEGADLSSYIFTVPHLEEADLSRLINLGLTRAITNTKLAPGLPFGVLVLTTNTDLCGADLRRANLRRANLEGADLRGADLREANLREANLTDTNLNGADLTKAKLDDPATAPAAE